MNILTTKQFKLPPFYDKDILDSTVHLQRLDTARKNIEILYPEVNNCNSRQYHIDNFDIIELDPTEVPIREHKYQSQYLLDWTQEWGVDGQINPYIQHHIQGHVFFGKVTVYTHPDTDLQELELERNIQATCISDEPIVIREAFNGHHPPSREAFPRSRTSRTDYDTFPDFELNWVPLVQRNLNKYQPPVGNGILRTRKELYPRLLDWVSHRNYFIDEWQGIRDCDIKRARYEFLRDYWSPGKLYKETEEIIEHHFEYHYVNRGRKRAYHEFQHPHTTKKRDIRLNERAYQEAIGYCDIVNRDQQRERDGILPKNTITILIQNTNKRKTRTSTYFQRNSEILRESWYQEVTFRNPRSYDTNN